MNLKIIGIGIIRVISTSKIKKITAIRKNCIEKGRREGLFGSYPHSKAEDFSREINLLVEIKELIIIKATGTIKVNIKIKKITLPFFF